MQQVALWLEKLGLRQYAQRFAENDITFAILSDLTVQDLKELGVSSLGHRRQLLRAIAELSSREKVVAEMPKEKIDRASNSPSAPNSFLDAECRRRLQRRYSNRSTDHGRSHQG
jgi:SAM domain (Sterile alpha motif)